MPVSMSNGLRQRHALFSILATTQNVNHSVSKLLLSVADRQMIKS